MTFTHDAYFLMPFESYSSKRCFRVVSRLQFIWSGIELIWGGGDEQTEGRLVGFMGLAPALNSFVSWSL